MATTSPWKPIERNKKKWTPKKHDHLCLETTETSSQRFCWCMCQLCWMNTGQTRKEKKQTGCCICRHCDCGSRSFIFVF